MLTSATDWEWIDDGSIRVRLICAVALRRGLNEAAAHTLSDDWKSPYSPRVAGGARRHYRFERCRLAARRTVRSALVASRPIARRDRYRGHKGRVLQSSAQQRRSARPEDTPRPISADIGYQPLHDLYQLIEAEILTIPAMT
jgi:hypothetical protein